MKRFVKKVGLISKVIHKGKKIGSKGRLHLSVLIQQENKRFIAHCLDLDIAGEGNTPEEAVKELSELINEQIFFAINNDMEELLVHPAPKEDWLLYVKRKAEEAKKEFVEHPPKSQDEILHNLDYVYA